MSLDLSNVPISGGVIVSGLAYAAAAVFILGPLVAERSIANSNWNENCEAGLRAKIEARRTPPKIIPRTDCNSIIGGLLPELAKLCTQFGNPDFGGATTSLIRKQEKVREEAENKRLKIAASQSGSQCSCAAALVTQDRSWAIHAGSLRLITPYKIENLQSELTRSLNLPHCAAKEM